MDPKNKFRVQQLFDQISKAETALKSLKKCPDKGALPHSMHLIFFNSNSNVKIDASVFGNELFTAYILQLIQDLEKLISQWEKELLTL